MRLSISNLAWKPEDNPSVLKLLSKLGVQGVEVAPTLLGNWSELDGNRLNSFRSKLSDTGLAVSSMQAIFFGVPQAALLGDEASFGIMRTHMSRVTDIASELGAEVAVFGAPRSRLRGSLSENDAHLRAIERFRQLGDIAAAADLTIGIEPVPAAYGGDFLTSISSVSRLVRALDHEFVRIHLDTGCAKLGGEAIGLAVHECSDRLCHFHAAEPHLSDFAVPQADHIAAARALRDVRYRRWVAIEMRDSGDDCLGKIEAAVRYVQNTYFSRELAEI